MKDHWGRLLVAPRIMRLAGLLYGWISMLFLFWFVVPEIPRLPVRWILSSLGILIGTIFYLLPAGLMRRVPLVRYVAAGVCLCTVAGLPILASRIVARLGVGPVLLAGMVPCGSSRLWGVLFFFVMEVFSVAGLLHLLFGTDVPPNRE